MKTKQNAALFMILLIILLPIQTASALTISNVNVVEYSNRYALINWETDEASSSLVKYDVTNTTLTLTKSDSSFVKNHTVLLSNLLSSTEYFFFVQSSNENGTAVDNKSNEYYKFTTDSVDTKPPFIIADLPRYNAGTEINIDVMTEPNALVVIYVNGNSSRSRVVDSTGRYTFINVRLTSGENIVEIVAQDPNYPANPETRKSFSVYADTSPPNVTYDAPVKKAYGTTTITLSGYVEDDSRQPVSMWFYLNGNLFDTKENLSSPWSTTVNFIEGFNDLRIVAQDVAGNEYDVTYEDIWVDTTPLQIDDDNLDEISPAYTLFQTIKGHVNKPRVKIVVLVNNKTSSGGEVFTTSVRDLIQSIAKGDISYSTQADDSGNFSVEVRLEQDPKLIVKETEQATASSLVKHTVDVNTGQYWLNEIKIIAIDENELWNATKEAWVVYTKCGTAGKWVIDISSDITPGSLPEYVFRAGFAQFSHSFKLKWGGATPKSDVVIHSIDVVRRSELMEARGGRLSLERELLTKNPVIYPAVPPYGETFYVTYELDKLTSDMEQNYKW